MPQILVIPRERAPDLPLEGCLPQRNLDFLQPMLWRERVEVEHDETCLQPIPYVLLHDGAGAFWAYARSGGDARLEGRRSCGVGGHVEHIDTQKTADATLRHAARRELAEELGIPVHALPPLTLQGLIYEGHSAIGRVHLGMLFTADWPGQAPEPPPHEALTGLGFLPATEIVGDERFELWSRLAVQFLLNKDAA
jgi:predicted NUDIX family phosphoesterase